MKSEHKIMVRLHPEMAQSLKIICAILGKPQQKILEQMIANFVSENMNLHRVQK